MKVSDPIIRTGHSTQSNVLSTAFFHDEYPASRSDASIEGSQRLSSLQRSRSSSWSDQKPHARPAAYAAPSAVVSVTAGRVTGTARTPARKLIRGPLAG